MGVALVDDKLREAEALLRPVLEDFTLFAPKLLRVVNKEKKVVPLHLNKAQLYVHDRLEQQLFEDGHVRALILKGRQQGMSTYTEGRFYWRTITRRNSLAVILTHLQEATNALFSMVERYHNNMHPLLRPKTSRDNAKELKFEKNDSGYRVSTAGSKATGRGSTPHYFHGSEVAYWDNAETHVGGAMQGIPLGNGTEVILESTANGVGGYFYKMWQQAEKGENDYIAIFVPWFWQEEYQRPCPVEWKPSEDELFYIDTYELSREQAYWMHRKNVELGGDVGMVSWLFLQEYPFTPADAFQVSGEDSICDPKMVVRARKTTCETAQGAHLMGVDPSRFGKDRSSWIHRRGRKAWGLKSKPKTSVTELAALVAKEIKDYAEAGDPVDKVFVDGTGIGGGVVDVLHEMGYRDLVVEVNAGEKASDPVRFYNKKMEMWRECAEWLEQPGVDIPDNDALHADLITPRFKFNTKDQEQSETKDQLKSRGADSPDNAEALVQTFAFPVRVAKRTRRRARRDWRAA